ncbi:MAG: GTP cyclohydrolase I FolE2 [Nitrososphaerota archaeon]|jgi:GTP cyclohydrolase FolE2|nr:GTP cyclohydrolase I FolE2 [Nitrososphaerota archaeon]MDG6927420.1 GTP cyclohydrolase I FolE2 [Nitrososphaerota archaeon]MDG6931224.1 GTP cyclohydrolase I FolE2 [Nitrososphaerota archaeon]MDG6931887.1 GTP cyclohydrolase I FolE2 [Nitrososphaerota archaeon]MDG6936593.1 GTP cyclohydrolase I FolE2 [Nitrososphaerota archaeon]
MQDEWKTVAKNSRDIQYEMPGSMLKIKSVGINGFRFPISNFSNGNIKYTGARARATVDIPQKMRGANMSRTTIGLTESLSEVKRIEDLAGAMAEKILQAHEYSLSSKVTIRGEGFMYTESPVSYLDSIERFIISERSRRTRDGNENNMLGITVTGISTCPCGAELMRTKLESHEEKITPTHMQRARLSVFIDFHGKVLAGVDDLLDSAYRSMSGSVYSTLKRADEAFVIYNSLKNTKFVEDIYRSAINAIYMKLARVGGVRAVYARAESFESIHGYNAIASGWLDWKTVEDSINPKR